MQTHKILRFVCAFILLSTSAIAQNTNSDLPLPDSLRKIVLIQPTGEKIDDLPEMIVLQDTSRLYKAAMATIDHSFIREAIDLYFLAQIYLKNKSEIAEIEPAYIALTKNQGGFAKFGFYLLDGGAHIDKSTAPYVDITEDRAAAKPDKLMSLTQLYPHELGHILYRLLSSSESREEESKNVDMHYFSVVTDYGIAFNEGFAEHLENVSRLYEKNEEISDGTQRDVERLRAKSPHYIGGFERDMLYPFRFGFYRATMVIWYQQFEDLIRYDRARDCSVKYKNATVDVSNIEDRLTFRNSGVRKNKSSTRNLVQALATEGIVSAFFTRLCQSQLPDIYQPAAFYRAFLYDTASVVQSPEKLFSPIQNLFLKYFVVLHDFVKFEQSEKSQLTDFIDGYVRTFPVVCFCGCLCSIFASSEALFRKNGNVVHLAFSRLAVHDFGRAVLCRSLRCAIQNLRTCVSSSLYHLCHFLSKRPRKNQPVGDNDWAHGCVGGTFVLSRYSTVPNDNYALRFMP